MAGGEGFGPDEGGAADGGGVGVRGASSARVTIGGAGASCGAIVTVVAVGIEEGDAAPADGGVGWTRAATCGSGPLADGEGFAAEGDGATAAAANSALVTTGGAGTDGGTAIAVGVTGFAERDVVEDIDVEGETGA